MDDRNRIAAVGAADLHVIEVSPEMTAWIGAGSLGNAPIPDAPITLDFRFSGLGATLRVHEGSPKPHSGSDADGFSVILVVSKSALIRIGGAALTLFEAQQFHVPTGIRAIALALREPAASPKTLTTYCLAKSIELLCETIRQFEAEEMIPSIGSSSLSRADTRRVLQARSLIDERSHEKHTLDSLSRACGLNREKLTRGFRELFGCSVADAIAERRLRQASHLLLTTDLPVAVVGHETGYLNNASFTRAFGRRFGRSPSHYRASRAAALGCAA
jgi:AraC family transcriptional activator of pyochelin receptor